MPMSSRPISSRPGSSFTSTTAGAAGGQEAEVEVEKKKNTPPLGLVLGIVFGVSFGLALIITLIMIWKVRKVRAESH